MTSGYDWIGRLLFITTVSIAGPLVSISCTPAPETTIAIPAPAFSAPALSGVATTQILGAHWIHGQALKQVMAELITHNPSWPSGMPQDPESKKVGSLEDFEKVALLANALMVSADQLPAVADKITMNEADRGGFLAEARVLHDQSQRLRDAATLHRIEQMQLHMNSINATCISCHSRYRDFSGQLDASNPIISKLTEPK
jgi:hypothetical protein